MKLKRYLFLLLAMFPLAAQAQDKPQPKPQSPSPSSDDQTIRIETQVVQLEVTVTDKQGKVIRDLKREDFELREDGKPQDIAYFSVGTSTRPARWLGTEKPNRKDATAANPVNSAPSETLAGRYIVLAIDDIHLSPATLMQAQQALTKFVEQQVGSGDQVALITTSGQLGLFQQFTNDRDILKRAIHRLSTQERQVTNSFDVPRITSQQAEMIDMGDLDALELAVQEILRQQGISSTPASAGASNAASGGNSGNSGGGRGGAGGGGGGVQSGISERERAIESARSLARMIVMQNAHYTRITLQTLQTIIRTLSSLPGRKIMTLVSDGFFLNARSANTFSEVRNVVDAATRAGVVIYSIDARGLMVSPMFDASQPSFGNEQPPGARDRIENSAMEALRNGPYALAHDTGGFMVMNTNDLNLGFQKVLQDTEAYYLLAFEPVEAYRDGRFRRLEVRVKNHPDYKVRSSKGYFATDEKAEAKAAEKEEKERVKLVEEREKNPEKAAKKEATVRNTRAWEALGSLFPLRGIPVAMSVDFVDTGKGTALALITAHLDVAGLKFEQVKGQYNATLEVIGSVFDEKGKPVDGFSQRLNMNLPRATYERVLQSGLVFSRRVTLKPGFYQVRLAALREGNKQTGSASDWVEVSDVSKKQLVLSSIFLTTEKETNYLMTQMDRRKNPNAADARTQEPAPIPTQVARRFKPGASFDFSLFAYNAKSDSKGATDLVVQSQIFSGSKVIFASPVAKMETPPDTKGENYAPYAARLSLDKFEPGAYELRMLVIDRVAKVSAKRTLNFVVEP